MRRIMQKSFLQILLVATCCVTVIACRTISPNKDYKLNHVYICYISKSTGYVIASNACDTTINNLEGREVRKFHLSDCKAGTIDYEFRMDGVLREQGTYIATRKRYLRMQEEVSPYMGPGHYIKTKARMYRTRRHGTWHYYDSTGVEIKTTVYR